MRPGVRPGPERDERRRGVRRPALVSNAPHDARAVREPFLSRGVVPRARRARRRARRDIWRRSDGRFGRLAATTTREPSRASLASISPPPPPRPRPELPRTSHPPSPPLLPPRSSLPRQVRRLRRAPAPRPEGRAREDLRRQGGECASRRPRRARRRRRRRPRRGAGQTAPRRGHARPRAPPRPPRANPAAAKHGKEWADHVPPTKENVGPNHLAARKPRPGHPQPRRRRRAQESRRPSRLPTRRPPARDPRVPPPRTRWTIPTRPRPEGPPEEARGQDDAEAEPEQGVRRRPRRGRRAQGLGDVRRPRGVRGGRDRRRLASGREADDAGVRREVRRREAVSVQARVRISSPSRTSRKSTRSRTRTTCGRPRRRGLIGER